MTAVAQVFDYNGITQIRTLVADGEPLFCVPDVCRGLEHSNPSVALRLVDDDDKRLIDLRETDSPNLNRTSINPRMWFFTEPGFYTLALSSQAPGAKAFKRWITHDVLPAIRKTGQYKTTSPAPPKSYAEALRELANTVEQRDEDHAKLAITAPKAEAWDTLAAADGDFSVADTAKILSRDPRIQVGQSRLFTELYQRGWLFRAKGDGRWRVYQQHIDAGRMAELPVSHVHPRTGERVIDPPQVRVTAKGLAELHRLLGGTEPLQLDP